MNVTATLLSMCVAWQDMQNIGKMRGILEVTDTGNLFLAYEGIRYAEPPTGERRFNNPVPVTENFNTEKVIDCLEVDMASGKMLGQEDCLFLNVYTPVPFRNMKKPVFVWIEGKAFPLRTSATSKYLPKVLVDRDIVVVTMSYRLGILGFASMERPSFPGNYGLKDQEVALEWVLKNIALFGGDPGEVTLAGEGAGAVYVLYHLNTTMAGRIEKGVALRGSRYAPWAMSKAHSVSYRTEELAFYFGCSKNVTADCMRSAEGHKLVRKAYDFQKESSLPSKTRWEGIMSQFKPVADGRFTDPWIGPGIKNNYTLLYGVKKNDYVIETFYNVKKWDRDTLNTLFFSFFQYELFLGKPRSYFNRTALNAIKQLYNTGEKALRSLKKVTSDAWYIFPSLAESKYHKGSFEAFMFDFGSLSSPFDCALQHTYPIHDGCSIKDEHFNRVARKLVDLIVRFVYGREDLELNTIYSDADVFSLTSALTHPSDLADIDVYLSKRIEKWFYLNLLDM